MPTGATTNIQLEELARRMRIPFFRGVFMRNNLPISGIRHNESGIVNLDNLEQCCNLFATFGRFSLHTPTAPLLLLAP